ncbi:hypothetical protein Q1695_013091 [Nippostrongylus brasiliensis]|nr:hypothetical protein Q1695_013091 [Nippostrongylus brasiliensis]
MTSFVLVLLVLPSLSLAQGGTGELPESAATQVATNELAVAAEANGTTNSTTISCSEKDASWLAWSEWTTCSDNCGSCGVHMRTRTCLTTVAACICDGESTTVEYCNLEICRYPRSTCCYNLKVTSYNGRFACLGNGPALNLLRPGPSV